MTDLLDVEIDHICAGLKQSAAKIRFLQSLGLSVRRKPNGAPLVNRAHYQIVMCSAGTKFADGQGDRSNTPVWGVH
jgi:hypothetical protein